MAENNAAASDDVHIHEIFTSDDKVTVADELKNPKVNAYTPGGVPFTGVLAGLEGFFEQISTYQKDQESGDLIDEEINYLTKRFEYEMDKEKSPSELLGEKKKEKEKKEKEEEGKKLGLEDLVKQITESQKGRPKEEKEKVYEGVKRGLSGEYERDFSNFEKYAPLFADSQERDADLFRYVGELSNDKLSPEARGELMGMLARSKYTSNKALREGQLGDNLEFTEGILDNFENYEKL